MDLQGNCVVYTPRGHAFYCTQHVAPASASSVPENSIGNTRQAQSSSLNPLMDTSLAPHTATAVQSGYQSAAYLNAHGPQTVPHAGHWSQNATAPWVNTQYNINGCGQGGYGHGTALASSAQQLTAGRPSSARNHTGYTHQGQPAHQHSATQDSAPAHDASQYMRGSVDVSGMGLVEYSDEDSGDAPTDGEGENADGHIVANMARRRRPPIRHHARSDNRQSRRGGFHFHQ